MLIDARTGEVYESTDALWAELERRIATGHRPRCPHGLRVPCTRCREATEPPRRRNTWSDEANSSDQPPEPAPAYGDEAEEDSDHAGEEDSDYRPAGPEPELTADDIPF